MMTTKNASGCYRLQRRRRHQKIIMDLLLCIGVLCLIGALV